MTGLRASTQEDRILASVTFNFARFVQWKAAAGSSAPLVLCVFDADASDAWAPFDGAKVGGRALAVKVRGDAEPALGCNIAYLSEAARSSHSPRLLADAGILTISNTENFARRGGAIELAIKGDKFQFEVNDDALREAGVRISSKLMRVGMKVSVPTQSAAAEPDQGAVQQAGR